MATINKITNPEDSGYPQVLQDEETQSQKPSREEGAKEILKRIYEKNIPEPKFDQAKADRLQKMGRINTMGRGIGVLGGMLATGLGAPIKKSAPDNTSNALYQSYSDNLDKYKSDQDIHSLRQYSKYLDDAKLGLSEERNNQSVDLQNRRLTAEEKKAEARDKLDNLKWQADYESKGKTAAEVARHNREMEKAALIRANKTGAANKANLTKIIQTKNDTHEISPAEYSFRRERALKNSKLLKTRFKNMFIDTPKLNKYNKPIPGQFVTSLNPDIKDDDLVRADIEMEENPTPPSPEVLKQNEQEYLEQHRQEKGLSTEPVKNVVSQPVSHPTIQPQSATKTNWNQYARPNKTKTDPLGLFQNNQSEEN